MVVTLNVMDSAAAFQTCEIDVFGSRDLSRTINGEVAFWVQITDPLLELMVQFLKALPSSDPKNKELEGFVNGEIVEVRSDACMEPNTATSRDGNKDSDWKSGDVTSGGTGVTLVVLSTNWIKLLAMLIFEIDVKYCKMTWSASVRVPYCCGFN